MSNPDQAESCLAQVRAKSQVILWFLLNIKMFGYDQSQPESCMVWAHDVV
jgi:hypothetical protein